MNIIELNHIDLNSIGLNSKVIEGVSKSHGGKVKPYIKGHVTDNSSTFTFVVNNNDSITVNVDSNGWWKWQINKNITTLYKAFYDIDNLDILQMLLPSIPLTGFSLNYAFAECANLKEITIKTDLTNCKNGGGTFQNSPKLETVNLKGFSPQNMTNIFFGTGSKIASIDKSWFANATTCNRVNMNGLIKELDLSLADNCLDFQYILQNNSVVTTLKLPNIGANVPFICGAGNNSLKNVTIKSTKSSLNFAGANALTEQSVVNLFNAVAADGITLTFHQNVWNMIMREIDVQGSPMQVAYQNMIDNYDVTIANASFDAEIEYLEFSGTQYINTGFKANTTTTRAETELQVTDTSRMCGLFGSRNSANSTNTDSCNVFLLDSNAFRLDWVNGDTIVQANNVVITEKYVISITRGMATVNNAIFTGTNTDSINQDYNFYIGTYNRAGATSPNLFIGRFYWFKIYSNNQLVHDFIPVRKGTTGYMYDKISGNLFGNSGTGDFVLGNDK